MTRVQPAWQPSWRCTGVRASLFAVPTSPPLGWIFPRAVCRSEEQTDADRRSEIENQNMYVYIYICILICHTQVFARHSGHPRGIPGMPQALNSIPGHIFSWEIRRWHSRGLKLAAKVGFIDNVAKNLVFCWLSKWGEAWGISFSRVRGGKMYSGQVNY